MKQNEAFMTSPIGDLPINSDGLRVAVDEIARLNKEIVKLKEDREKCINTLSDHYTFKTTQDGLCNVFKIIRTAAIKEFAEKVKHNMYRKSIIQLKGDNSPDLYTDDMEKVIDELLKEYGVEL